MVSAILAGIGCLTHLSRPSQHVHWIQLPGWEEPQAAHIIPDHALITVHREGPISLNGHDIAITSLSAKIRSQSMRYPMVLLRPDADVPTSTLLKVLQAIRTAGVIPSRICFDDLARYRVFEKEPYPENTIARAPPREKKPEAQSDGVIAGSAGALVGSCNTLTQPPPIF